VADDASDAGVEFDADVVATVPEDDGIELAAVRTLNPFTCIPNTTVGPVETAVDAGTVDVARPQEPPSGVVDS
jgi:hypothetical protein